jgi:hypothetical protein
MEINPEQLKKTTLAKAPAEKFFYVCRGDKIDNLRDLANCIESLNAAEFKHHVNDKRNDFAAWVADVFKNPALGRDLNYPINISDQKHYVKTLRDHLKWLESV